MPSKKNSTQSDPNCTEELEEGSHSILLGIIAQLRKDMDLHRITLPTFVLEPRSMLERITDFMSHPDLLISAVNKEDPLERFIDVVRYFLSGWHIRPKGVRKPYNPVLGEFFRCRWKYDNGTQGVYVAEQVSHHPPVSAYFFASPDNGIMIHGDIRPKARFLGNSAATMMEGGSHIIFTQRNDERYDITMPNVYAKGILFGKMAMELGDSCTVRCSANDLVCELDFKTKGFFSGDYNSIAGKIKKESTGQVLYELSGQWSGEMHIKEPKTSTKKCLLSVTSETIHPKLVEEEARQEPSESRRLWSKVTQSIQAKDMDTATVEKTAIEDRQRQETHDRKTRDESWHPRFFDHVPDDQYIFKDASLDFTQPATAQTQLDALVFSHQDIPPSKEKLVTSVNTNSDAVHAPI